MTTFFFDWDDTLMASTEINMEKDEDDTNNLDRFKQLEKSAISILTEASLLGKVFIVTNAEKGWVEHSATNYMPNLLPVLKNIDVMSARSTHETNFPEKPLLWKFAAFSEQLQKCSEEERKHIISIGDSHVERNAARAFKTDNTLIKTIKLSERPTCLQLKRQLDLLKNCLKYVCDHKGDLDLQLTITFL